MTDSQTDNARATLRYLADVGLPPTPENYAVHFNRIAGQECSQQNQHPNDENEVDYAEFLPRLRSLVEAVSHDMSNLVSTLTLRDENLDQFVDELKKQRRGNKPTEAVDRIVSIVKSIRNSVKESHPGLLEVSDALGKVNAKLQQTWRSVYEDALTGAQNRRAMDKVLAREVARCEQSSGSLTVVMIDLDHFKRVNDLHGHYTGDKLLIHVTMLARSVLREADALVRYGGEEFLLILPDTDLKGAQLVAERLSEVFSNTPFDHNGERIAITFSGGIAQLKEGENGQSLILRADSMLYAAKRAGRNCYKASTGQEN